VPSPEDRFGNDRAVVARFAELEACAPLQDRLDYACPQLHSLRQQIAQRRADPGRRDRLVRTLLNLLESRREVSRLVAAESLFPEHRRSEVRRALQAALDRPGASLEGLAASALAEQELNPELAPAAMEAVRSVQASPLWARAMSARRRFAEVPFQVPWNATGPGGSSVPGILRGVIDLVFEEPDGWVLVDYKTDQVCGPAVVAAAARYAAQVRLYARAWKQCTGQPVKEAGLFFTRAAEYIRLASVEGRPVHAGAA
jgi:ATP-dependent exoDNAse (exonuclease V) beta subunit